MINRDIMVAVLKYGKAKYLHGAAEEEYEMASSGVVKDQARADADRRRDEVTKYSGELLKALNG